MDEFGFNDWPCFTSEEANLISDVLLSNRVNYWTGEQIKNFEVEFADWVGTSYAIALMNGTVALDLALHCLGVGVGDEVIVTPRSFIASASAVVNCGARPKFADVDKNSGNITAETIQQNISPQTKAIVCVHLAGWPCDMEPILALAKKHDIAVIEDCAQAHGAKYKGKSVGSFGDVAAWSFCQDKIMTTGGEGGMVTCNNRKLWEKMWSYKDHGKAYQAVFNTKHPPGFRWLHESIGTNWRMTEIQAAIGRAQLVKMSQWKESRQKNALAIVEALKHFVWDQGAVRTPLPQIKDTDHAFYKYYIYADNNRLNSGWSRDRILKELNSLGVPCLVGACPEIYNEKAFQNLGLAPTRRLPGAQKLGEEAIMFPVHPTITAKGIEFIIASLRQVFQAAAPMRT